MTVIENTETLRRFAALLANLNKEGLDTKLIELGQEIIPKLGDDEVISLQEDYEKVKLLLTNYQEEHWSGDKEEITKKEGKPVIRAYVDGCYDLIHAGHYNAFRQAAKLGDQLVWGVNSDLEITNVKGPPVFNTEERCIIVGAWKWIDEVAVGTEYTPTVEILNRYNWDFYAHGDDIALNSEGLDSSHEMQAVGRYIFLLIGFKISLI